MAPRLFVALVALPLLADMFDRFIAWAAKRYRKEIEEGGDYPPFSFLLWVRVVHSNQDYDHDLWVVKLPFFRWEVRPWSGETGWTQLALLNRRPFQRREIFNGDGWRAIWMVAR